MNSLSNHLYKQDKEITGNDITSTKSLLRFIFIIVTSLALLTWIFLQTSFFTSQEHINYLHLLDKHQEIEAKLDAEVLASKMDLTENYDALNHFLKQVNLLSNKIKTLPQYLLLNDQKLLTNTAEKLDLMIVEPEIVEE